MDDSNLAMVLFTARLIERFVLTLVILGAAVVLMAVFRKSVERIRFETSEKLNLSADLVLATPLFALLIIVGYSYVSFSHPIALNIQETAARASPSPDTPANDDGDIPAKETASAEVVQNRVISASGLAPDAPSSDISKARTDAATRIKSLNCLLDTAPAIDSRMDDAVRTAKLALLLDPGVWDNENWGSASATRLWAIGIGQDPPEEVIRIFNARHEPCVQQ